MKDTLKAGVSSSRRFDIDRERTIAFMGDELRVYATPNMVRDMEHTCRDLIMEHAEGDEDSVGAHIAVDHMGATLLGMHVDVSARIVEVEGPRITFELEVHDPLEQVGRGKHVRFVINKEKQGERLRKKAQKVKDMG
ncbi:MAG: thioesterase family protein [Alphaproteobacteria bacterium]